MAGTNKVQFQSRRSTIMSISSGILYKFHMEVIKAQRWDLSKESRLTITICLN